MFCRILLKEIVCDLNQDDPHSHDSFWSPIRDKRRKFSVISFQECQNVKNFGEDRPTYVLGSFLILTGMGLTNLSKVGGAQQSPSFLYGSTPLHPCQFPSQIRCFRNLFLCKLPWFIVDKHSDCAITTNNFSENVEEFGE